MRVNHVDVHALALLDEPVRRALYEWVVDAGRAVSRDEAAAGVEVSRALAAFHLDRLAGAGLLVAEYRRLSGRTGPGAGRPAKLYRRGVRETVVSLPERHYEVVAQLFATTIEQLGEQLAPDALSTSARDVGASAALSARQRAGPRPGQRRLRAALIETLADRGYEPREASGDIVLGNCPFHALVDDHRELVCGTNLALLDELINGLGISGLVALKDPRPGQCCVVIGRGGHA